MDLRVAAAQLDVTVGDLEGNVARILEALHRAEAAGCEVCVFPELAITGYPPEDLLLKSGFVADNEAALEEVARATSRCVAVVGFVRALGQPCQSPPPEEREWAGARIWGRHEVRLANAAALCATGKVVSVYHKRLLPNYSVFDERRWFTPGEGAPIVYRIAGALVGVSICEDAWAAGGPVATLGRAGAQLVVNLNASPYSRGRRAERLAMLESRVQETGCAIVYVNLVGGQDELVFDGASLFLGEDKELVASGAQFEEDLVIADLHLPKTSARDPGPVVEIGAPRAKAPALSPELSTSPPRALLDPDAEVYAALVLGTRDYLGKNGFTDAVVALSGGIDSSLVATIAVDAIGPAHVHGIAMPSRYSSPESLADATDLAQRLGIDLQVVPIDEAHGCISDVLGNALGAVPRGVTDENLQSRIRGVLVMGISNAKGWIVLTTGNKSEMATGYSTLYGDTAGGFAVIKDVPKTLVYALCRARNARAVAEGGTEPVPQRVLDKPPSAELRPDQRDDQSLPPYELLDPALEAYVERDRTAEDLVSGGLERELAERVVRLVDGAEYKRRQTAPGVRITDKAFGRDRRMPITNGYRRPARPERPAPSRAPDG